MTITKYHVENKNNTHLYYVFRKVDPLIQHLRVEEKNILHVAHFGDALKTGFDSGYVRKETVHGLSNEGNGENSGIP